MLFRTLRTFLFVGVFLTPLVSWGQALNPQQPSAAQLLHRMNKLMVVGKILYVAAHPDDENTRLLSYLVGERKLATAYLSLTRGDGGQNLIGREQAGLLGVIRTQELMSARRLDGAQQFFSRVKDFGYSKSSVESLKIWNKQAVLADTVWVIRRFRPDVIITRFPETGRTHGHHLASAQLARAAMTAAADNKQFPEQLKHVKPWQAHRLVYNVSTWRLRRQGLLKNKKYLSQFLQLDVGGFHPLLGFSYGEISARSRSMHKSQGFGARSQRGPIREFFAHIAGKKAKRDILDGINLSWSRIPGGATVVKHLMDARIAFRPTLPSTAIPSLIKAWQAMSKLSHPAIPEKKRELRDVIVGCLGLFLDARASTPAAVPGSSLSIKLTALNRSSSPLQLTSVQVTGGKLLQVGTSLQHHKPWRSKHKITMAAQAQMSGPSWLRKQGTLGAYAIPDLTVVERPEDPAPLRAVFQLKLGDISFAVTRAVRYVWTDRVRGEQARRVEVMPPLTATPRHPVVMFPTDKPQPMVLDVRAAKANVKATLRLQVPKGWVVQPASITLQFKKRGEVQRHRFLLQPPKEQSSSGVAVPVVTVGKRSYSWKEHVLNYPHLPVQTILEPASVKLVSLKLKAFQGKVGYIAGSGDFVAPALRQVGVNVHLLDKEAVTSGQYKGYQTIVTGIRAYNKNQALRLHNKRLLDWVKQGGTLVVQYSTNSRWRPLKIQVGPYPMNIGRDRVTNEHAPIQMTQPKHPLLQTPHKIGPADFVGWIQERGLYFAKTWDPRYKTILRMADPNKKPSDGSLLVAHYGKGAFLYTGISFFRQLPAGVPGAYRLFMNLISYRNTVQPTTKRQKP